MGKKKGKRGNARPAAVQQAKASEGPTQGKATSKNQRRRANRRMNNAAEVSLVKPIPRLPHLDDVPDVPRGNQILLPYDGISSLFRINRDGFHPMVTRKTPEEIYRAWSKMANKAGRERRPSREAFLKGTVGFNQGNYSYSKRMLLAWSVVLPEENAGDLTGPENALDRMFYNTLWKGEVSIELAGDGFKTLQNLSAASPSTWSLLKSEIILWDNVAQRAHGRSDTETTPIFISVSPEYTNGDFTSNFHAPNGDSPVTELDIRLERIVEDVIRFAGADRFADISHDKSDTTHPWHMTSIASLHRLPGLLKAIHLRKDSIEVLMFQKTDMLDRRVLATILRACPKVTMLGVYDCPLLHFGDAICLLDLINEVNVTRRGLELPEIEAFDFYPRYHYGAPYHREDKTAYTCGITWNMTDNEIIQRGFYRIILEAYLKASKMGIKLLFEENHAFRDFLFRVPGLPLAVPSFLDGLVRYVELIGRKTTDVNLISQAKYDMLKPLRMSLTDIRDDARHFYPEMESHQLLFCCSCGNEMLQEFFTDHTRRVARPHRRVCAGCILRKQLDEEQDHGKWEKNKGLSGFFPNWVSNQFNHDASLDRRAEGLFRLKSTESTRPAPPLYQVDINGNVSIPRYEEPLVRDYKTHKDSVQNLPSLGEILALPQEQMLGAESSCIVADIGRLNKFLTSVKKTATDHVIWRPIESFDIDQPPPQPPPGGVSNFANQWDFSEAIKVFCLWKIRKLV